MQDTYTLYVGDLQEIPDGIRFSFYNDEHRYILIFSAEPPEGAFLPVGEQLLSQLSDREALWLLACKATINAEHMAKHGEQYVDLLYEYADAVEDQLQKEYEKKQRKESE